MYTRSVNIGTCSCRKRQSVEDYVRCAPCPPMTMTYEEFRDHARTQTLEARDICLISKRCFNNHNAIYDDCPPSIFVCPKTTTIKTETSNKTSADNGILTICIISLSLIIGILCCIAAGYVLIRKRPNSKISRILYSGLAIFGFFKSCNVKEKHDESRTSETLEQTELLSLRTASPKISSESETSFIEQASGRPPSLEVVSSTTISSNIYSESETSITDKKAKKELNIKQSIEKEEYVEEQESERSRLLEEVTVDIHTDEKGFDSSTKSIIQKEPEEDNAQEDDQSLLGNESLESAEKSVHKSGQSLESSSNIDPITETIENISEINQSEEREDNPTECDQRKLQKSGNIKDKREVAQSWCAFL